MALNIPGIASVKTALMQSFAVGFIWLVFYQFSTWAFAYFEYNPRVSWVFLPAGIRMMAVFVFEWNGVLGLLVGSVITNENEIDESVIGLSFISALAPMLALTICRWAFDIPKSLIGLTGLQLLVFALTGAFANAFLSQIFLHSNDAGLLANNFLPMFVGDILGTLIIFYLIAKLLDYLFTKHNANE